MPVFAFFNNFSDIPCPCTIVDSYFYIGHIQHTDILVKLYTDICIVTSQIIIIITITIIIIIIIMIMIMIIIMIIIIIIIMIMIIRR